MSKILPVIILVGLPLLMGAAGWILGSQYTYQAAVAHFSADPYKSYMAVETLNYGVEAGLLGYGCAFLVIAAILTLRRV